MNSPPQFYLTITWLSKQPHKSSAANISLVIRVGKTKPKPPVKIQPQSVSVSQKASVIGEQRRRVKNFHAQNFFFALEKHYLAIMHA